MARKKVIKDEFGRVQYTTNIKTDDEGNPKWKILPLDLEIFSGNVRRYGLWYDELLELKDAIIAPEGSDATEADALKLPLLSFLCMCLCMTVFNF
jgi:hypothetical protein